MLAENASAEVRTKRESTCSSTMTRGKARTISEGIGTMKRLMRPRRMRASIRPIITTIEPSPSASGNQRDPVSAVDRVIARARYVRVLVRPRTSPLPVAGRGRGWGWCDVAPWSRIAPPPAPTLPRKGGGRRRARRRVASARHSCALPPLTLLRLLVAQTLGRLLAQVVPDLRHVAAEGLAGDDLGGARPRQINVDHALEP